MLKAYKVELHPTEAQITKIRKTIGVCRYVYNLFIATTEDRYKNKLPFMNAFTFSKWFNNEFLPKNEDKQWIREVSSKAVKQSMFHAERAYKDFFSKKRGRPKFKKKGKLNVGCYFPKNNRTDWKIERHRVNVPTLGWIRLKEFGYISKNACVKSGTITYCASKYFVSILCEEQDIIADQVNDNSPIGVDVGLKHFAIVSNGKIFNNINKGHKIKTLEKRLKREQRRLSRKLKRRRATDSVAKNVENQLLRVQKLHYRLKNIRNGYVKSVVVDLVKTKPSYIAIEDLNINGMMRNRHLSKAIQSQCFYMFKEFLKQQCLKHNIELRIVDRFYPSSKLCHECGGIKHDLKLSDRIYVCECGNSVDRDFNAALNIRDCKTYKIAS